MLLAHKRLAQRYNQGRKAAKAEVGDQVFIQGPNGATKGELVPRFVGPSKVISITIPVNLLVRDLQTGRKSRVHVSQVKEC